MSARNELQVLIKEQALSFGNFTLASGKQASYYLDCKQVTPECTWCLSNWRESILEKILELGPQPDSVGGMAMVG